MPSTLLIDDDQQVLDTVQSLASDAGVPIAVAPSWDIGLALFHTLGPDLVIADYSLEGSRHGLQLLLEIKRLRPGVRVILISGVVNPDELGRVQDLGLVDRVMSKGQGTESIRGLLDEIVRADKFSDEPTDWRAAARRLMEHQAIDEKAIAELDDRMRTQAERNG